MITWRGKTTIVAALAIGFIAAVAGCGGKGDGPTATDGPPQSLAACGSAPFLTVPLVAAGNVNFVSPLGNLNPPGHTFPTDHIYLYMSVVPTLISAPGDLVLSRVVLQHRTGGGQAAVDDYALAFYPCADVMMELGHVARLGTQLSTRIGSLDGSCGSTYQTGGFSYQQCRKEVNISLAAGEAIGVTAGSLDFLARDRRITHSYVNASRLSDPVGPFGDSHAVCPLDYFVPSAGDPIRAKLGGSGAARTVPPVCGEVMQDVPNTAAGRWFHIGSPTHPEDPHLALVHDNVDPATGAFSVGSSIPSLPSGVYKFAPASTGRVNPDFHFVSTVGEMECYATTSGRRILVQLTSLTRLRIEGFGTGACGDPGTWTFSTGAVEFER